MFKAVSAFLLVLFSSSNAFAQENKVFDTKFFLASAYLVDATIFDMESTYAGLKNCSDCFETNPILEPFINKGRPAAYLFQGAINGLVIYESYYLKKRGSKFWWLGPVALGSIHAVAGGFNLRFVF